MTLSRFLPLLLFVALLPLAGFSAERESRRHEKTVLPADAVVDGPHFMAGETVEIYGTVNGDLYAAGGRILLEGTVNGDLLAAGGNIVLAGRVARDARLAGGQITIEGEIEDNLTAASGNLELTGAARVGGSLVAAGGSLRLAGPVGSHARLAAGDLTISNQISGNVEAAIGELRLTPKAVVEGNLTYWSDQPAFISPQARIGGQTTRRDRPEGLPEAEDLLGFYIGFKVLFVLASFVSTLVLGLLLLRFYPVFSRRAAEQLAERPGPVFGWGLVFLIIPPILAPLLAATILGLPLAALLISSYLITLYLARIFPIYWLGLRLFRKLDRPGHQQWAFVAGLGLYSLITLIPLLGGLATTLALLAGPGMGWLTKKETYLRLRRQEII